MTVFLYHKLGGFKQEVIILLQIRRQDVQNQVVSRVGSFLGSQRQYLFLPP